MSDEAREVLLDHAHNRRNEGVLDPCDMDVTVQSETCRDWLRLTLRLDGSYNIIAVGWTGEGCAVSQAASSLLGEYLIGKPLMQAVNMTEQDMLILMGMPLSGQREQCALLAWHALKQGLKEYMGS